MNSMRSATPYISALCLAHAIFTGSISMPITEILKNHNYITSLYKNHTLQTTPHADRSNFQNHILFMITSFTGECKLYCIATDSTKCIDQQVTLTAFGNMSSNLLRSGTEPTLWEEERERGREGERKGQKEKMSLYKILKVHMHTHTCNNVI